MEAIYNVISQNPETAIGVLAWSTLCFGFFVGMFQTLSTYVFDFIFGVCLDKVRERKAKKSGKLTTEQCFELLEEKIVSLADIVIFTSEEVK